MERHFRLALFSILLVLVGCGGSDDDGNAFFPDNSNARADSSSTTPTATSADGGTTVTTSEGGVIRSTVVDPGKATMRILAFGDSNTEGFGVTQPWPDKLELSIGQPVFREGVLGDGTQSGLERLPSLLTKFMPTHVLILEGTNDAVFGGNAPTALADLAAMIDLSLANGAEVVVGTLPPMVGAPPQMAAVRQAIDDGIPGVAASRGAKVAQISQALGNGTTTMQADGLHMNDAGHAIVAALFQEQL